ncbi:MAG: DUF502 domain-containing protein [Deltaproteobacteria bacterium]|nr:DUF502 domain-containing protein [Deltaproteobacteria bacterium]
MRSLFKKYFIAGALVLVPIVVTVWILRAVILWCEAFFTALVPLSLQPINLFGIAIPGLGLLFTLLLILMTGMLTRLYLGRKILEWSEKILNRIPFGSSIYSAMKQFMNAVVSSPEASLRQVVLVEYPRRGSFMIGFVTGNTPAIIEKKLGQKSVNIFIPTSPNPTSGFLIIVPMENVTPIDIPADQAFKLIISGGAISS